MVNKIKDFKDLIVWQHSHNLAVLVYKITENFPKSELFSLTNQMRRSCVSVSSNISEGFGRNTYREKIRFYYISQGSLIELKNQILISFDIGYMDKEDYLKIMKLADETHKTLQGLIKTSKSFLNLNS